MNTTKDKLYEIIFEADTKAGKLFDVALLFVILLSILLVMLESVKSIERNYKLILSIAEWSITLIFTIEYIMRIWVVRRAKTYILSFYGIVDLLSILPSYLGLIFAGTHGLVVIRALRLLRVFRILKLNRYTNEGREIILALRASRAKISVFLFAILTLIIIIGTLMYLIEGESNGFTSIPRGIYWAVVTLTTVGYGDISPATPLGQLIAGIVMIMGYSIIAVPTGIVSAEMSRHYKKPLGPTTQVCPNCLKEGHDKEALYCKFCGTKLN